MFPATLGQNVHLIWIAKNRPSGNSENSSEFLFLQKKLGLGGGFKCCLFSPIPKLTTAHMVQMGGGFNHQLEKGAVIFVQQVATTLGGLGDVSSLCWPLSSGGIFRSNSTGGYSLNEGGHSSRQFIVTSAEVTPKGSVPSSCL